jgi:hypothetical protein
MSGKNTATAGIQMNTPSHPSVELQGFGPPALACHITSEIAAAGNP